MISTGTLIERLMVSAGVWLLIMSKSCTNRWCLDEVISFIGKIPSVNPKKAPSNLHRRCKELEYWRAALLVYNPTDPMSQVSFDVHNRRPDLLLRLTRTKSSKTCS